MEGNIHFWNTMTHLNLSPLSLQELSPKIKRRYDSFEAIMDPSRNQKVLRAYQSKLPCPVTPFMPLVMKGTHTSPR